VRDINDNNKNLDGDISRDFPLSPPPALHCEGDERRPRLISRQMLMGRGRGEGGWERGEEGGETYIRVYRTAGRRSEGVEGEGNIRPVYDRQTEIFRFFSNGENKQFFV